MLRITVTNSRQSEEFTLPFGQRAVLGRHVVPAPGTLDVWLKDSTCSRNQLSLTEQPGGSVLVENLSSKVCLEQPFGHQIVPQDAVSKICPFTVSVGTTKIDVQQSGEPGRDAVPETDSATPSLRAVKGSIDPARFWTREAAKPDVELSQDNLLEWFSALIAVQRSAAGSVDFYQEIADATVNLVGLDYGLVLLLTEDGWLCVAARGVDRMAATWSETVVRKTIDERRTFYGPLDDLGVVQSLASFDAVVAAPILNIDDSVVGVIYGARRASAGQILVSLDSDGPAAGVSELEAQLVQVLAASAATGLARAEKEAEAAKLRGQFEDFCSPEVVRELYNNPALLQPSERFVTVMFCDVRGFTRLCERLSPADSNAVTTEILDQIAECILQADGLIIDFYGDGIAAMWNAPCDQQNHARRAVNCALQVQQTMSRLRAASQDSDRQGLRVGIGIHTGMALVGNVGGSRRLKYGPRGNTVNLASRIEGVTKYLGVDVLLSAATATEAQVGAPESRRLGSYQLAGTENAVELYEYLGFDSTRYSLAQLRVFDSAVTAFESGCPEEAEQLLVALTSADPADVKSAARVLLDEIRSRHWSPDDKRPRSIQIHSK